MTAGAVTAVTIVGRGRAGAECAWQLAERGIAVTLLERDPARPLRTHRPVRRRSGEPAALLEQELRRAGSVSVATPTQLRERLDAHPDIEVKRAQVTAVPGTRPLVLASGPLSGDGLSRDIAGRAQARLSACGSRLDAPLVLDESLRLRGAGGTPDEDAAPYVAGRLAGVDGDLESAACGLCVGVWLALRMRSKPVVGPPRTTALGSLLASLRRSGRPFAASRLTWTMFPALEDAPGEASDALADRALAELEPWLDAVGARLVRARASGAAGTGGDPGGESAIA